MPWPDVGVPAGAHARGILYSVPARLIVAHVTVDHRLGLSRLYGRTLVSDRYTELLAAADDESLEYPAVCGVTPHLYYMVEVKEAHRGRHSIIKDGKQEWVDDEQERVGGWIKGIFQKNLVTGAVRPIVEYRIREEHDEWVSQLHGVCPDGKALLCSAAHVDQGATSEYRSYSHSLCSLDVETGVVTKLAPLRAVFF